MKVVYRQMSREAVVEALKTGLPSLRKGLPVTRAVLFGSWARDRATAFSDIDLLVVYEGAPRADAYKVVRRAIPLRGLEPHVYSEAEAAVLAPTLDRMTADGIDLL